MLTATAELWGFPLLKAGDPWGVTGVSRRFEGKWWIKEITHKIDRSTGFTTKLDMQKNALGIGDPAAGNPADSRDNLVDIVLVYDFHTGVGKFVARPTAKFYDVQNRNMQTYRRDQEAVRIARNAGREKTITEAVRAQDAGEFVVVDSGQYRKP